MPRYHFHVEDGSYFPDDDGTVLQDDQTARQEGLRFVEGLIGEEPMRLALGASWALVIVDAFHRTVLRVAITNV